MLEDWNEGRLPVVAATIAFGMGIDRASKYCRRSLRCAVLCCAVLCCAVLCCAETCRAVSVLCSALLALASMVLLIAYEHLDQ